MAVTTIDDLWRDFDADGQPASGAHHPLKQDIRDTLKALLEGSSVFPDNRVIRLNNANEGDANTIKVSSSVAIPSAAYQVLYVLNVTRTNTGPVKVTGAFNRTLVTNTSKQVPAGYLTPGMAVLCIDTGSTLRMLSYGDMETLIVEAEDAVSAAKAARDLAAGYASDAVSQGNVPIYGTVQGVSALTIPAGVNAVRLNGFAASGDGGGWPLAREVANSGTLTAWQRQTNGGTRRWELVSDYLSPLMFGAPADGVTIADAAINTAIALAKARGQKFIDGNGLKYKVSSRTAVSNLYGVELRNMYLIEDVSDGNIQVNTYADQNQRWFGREYLWALYNWIKVTSNPIKMYCYGDSTMLGPSGWPDGGTPFEAFVQSMWPRQARQLGLKQPLEVVNRGVGGQSISGMNFATDLANGMQAMMLKYAINDAMSSPDPDIALKTFAEALDAKLTDVRNHEKGNIYNLSIILVGASSTYDPASDRDASWFERLRGVYEAAARKHRCFYFDTYGYMQDSRWAIGAWLDDAGLHPEAVGYWWIFGHLFNLIFQPNDLEYWRRNHVTNTGGAFDKPLPSHNLNTEYFNYGHSLKFARTTEGFPASGGLLTLFQADRAGLQMLFPTNSRGVILTRTYNPEDGIASFGSVWTGDVKGITFSNGWQEFDIPNYGSSYAIRTNDGLVHVRLCIRAGTVLSAGAVIGVLPAGYRPVAIEQFSCFNISGAAGRIDVTTAGNIRIVGGVTADMLNASFAFRAN